MNKYTAMALSTVAHVNARRVLILSASQVEARAAFDHFGSLAGAPHIARVLRANGRESIEFAGGGRIDFASIRSNLRGREADVVFIDNDADRLAFTYEAMRELFRTLREIVATSPDGEVVRA